jgi:predicted O-linked N-acetylglucosamine transferase (SPINDLY family)
MNPGDPQRETGPADDADITIQRALELHRQGRLDEAEVLYRRALQAQPRNFHALLWLGLVTLDKNQCEPAVDLLIHASRENPQSVEAHLFLGRALARLKRYAAALSSYDAALVLDAARADVHISRGTALRNLGRPAEAMLNFERAIALQPHNPEAHNNRGNALRDLEQPAAALASYERALELRPDSAEIHNNRGNAQLSLGQCEAALASYERAVALKPRYAEAHNNRGVVLARLKRHEAALASCATAIALRPDFANAYNARGTMLADLGQFESALADYERALALAPDLALAHHNRGNALRVLHRYPAAAASYSRAVALDPRGRLGGDLWLHVKMQMADWRDLEAKSTAQLAGIADAEPAFNPFLALTLVDDPEVHLETARIWVKRHCPADDALPPIPPRQRSARIKLGYFSADFHDHATSYLMAGLFEEHDRKRFEVTAFSFGPASTDAMRQRLQAACESFIDVRTLSDREIATQARSLGLDIAVDLKGFTQGNRAGIFALRAAPVQVSYLGYPGTMSADYMDYLVADPVVVPRESRRVYREKIMSLPDCYQVNDARRSIADRQFGRTELGLPQDGFVFCCFNNTYKITPAVFARWMRILGQVPSSVLWLLQDNAWATNNLRREASLLGIDAGRLVFAARTTLPEHLARHAAADLFLDTLPYNAHTTASDALWAGLPVLTLAGSAFAARVAASLVTAVGMPELIATSTSDYERRAVEWALHPVQASELRIKLASLRATGPLFDTRRFARRLEQAYTCAYERNQAGLAPEHIELL